MTVSPDPTGGPQAVATGDGHAAPSAMARESALEVSRTQRLKALQPAPTRAQAAALYNVNYLAGQVMPPMSWTGNVAACDPGSTAVAYQQSIVDRVNVYRKLARLAPVNLYSPSDDKDERTAAAALLMAANNALSHNPPSTWNCYGTAFAGSTVGVLGGGQPAGGAGNSNLGWSSGNAYATNAVIDAYMVDSGAGNQAVGHRTGILDAKQTVMAVGSVPVGPGHGAANALWWINFSTRTGLAATPEGVAWPPNGFVPFQLLPAGSNRWSFQYPGANFSAATVSMSSGGAAYAPLVYDYRSTGCPTGFTCLPDDAIVWQPPLDAAGIAGVSYAAPGATDKAYTVTIAGVTGAGVPSSFSYTVTVIDPSVSPSQTVSGTVTNGASGVSGVSFCAKPASGVTCTTSTASGLFSCTVPFGWSGVLHSPMVNGYRIAPLRLNSVTAASVGNVVLAQPGIPTCNLDVDDNGLFEPDIDGIAIARRIAGFSEAATFDGLSGACAANTTSNAVFGTTQNSYVANGYDVTGSSGGVNGAGTRAAVDGTVLLRAMAGQVGTAVTNGVGISSKPGATRTTWATIQPWLNANCGANF
ncbi:MAG: hypothetical protein JNL19_06210 [Burkholderiales bacterium]|nr:hypothetical protein [Burkholderiales bacterium]